MKLFKNFKTKKQLREEIEKLKEIQRHMEYKERNPVLIMFARECLRINKVLVENGFETIII